MSTTGRANPSNFPGTRFRLAGLLLVMTVAILASKFWEDFYIDSLRRDCGSLFRDRLMPATMLFQLGDDFHTKRHVLVEHLEAPATDREPSIEYEMGRLDASIDHVVDRIETTYLVAEESRLLEALEGSLESYRQLERDRLTNVRNGEAAAYDEEIRAAFREVSEELLSLTKVQQVVGQELDRSSVANVTHMNTLIYFQLGVAFVLGLLASALAMGLTPHRIAIRHQLRKARRLRAESQAARSARTSHGPPAHRTDMNGPTRGRRFREPPDRFRDRGAGG